ncbi:MAG: DUF932 domain-containing protein [Candidatus Aminicenantales bacterium]
MNLQTMIDELETQKPLKWDRKLNAAQIAMALAENTPILRLPGEELFSITKPCHTQIAEKLEIPLKYYHKMEESAPDLLVSNVNTWLRKNEKDIFIRGLGNSVRAFLSDRYRVIDHLDVLLCALNELQAHDAEIEDCYLSEIEMNIKVKSQKLKDFVRHKDDLIMGGIFITNSETGHKALRVEPRMFRVKCSNGMIVEELVTREIHIGNSDEISDEIVYLSLRRSIRELFSRFGEIVLLLRESAEAKIRNPQKVIQNVVEQYKLSEAQKANILMAFGAEPEYDKYGIANALTLAAQKEETWEKSVEMERIAGNLITLPVEDFKALDEM